MGRRNKAYKKSLTEQLYNRLTEMQAFGESKKKAKADGTIKDKIFCFNTYKSYYQQGKYFVRYLLREHPEITTLKAGKKYVTEYLQTLVDQGYAAHTIHTAAKALGKVYGLSPDDKDYFHPPVRHRKDIKRSRNKVIRDKNFSESKNQELIVFCKGTGLRRSELKSIKGKDLWSRQQIEDTIAKIELIPIEKRSATDSTLLTICQDTRLFNKNQNYFIYTKGKGGRERLAPIIGPKTDQIVERIQKCGPDEKVWPYVHTSADVHAYRADFCTEIYKLYARDIEKIPYDQVNKGSGHKFQSEVYVCRKDKKRVKLDRQAMKICSKSLGHNRVEIVAGNYLRNI